MEFTFKSYSSYSKAKIILTAPINTNWIVKLYKRLPTGMFEFVTQAEYNNTAKIEQTLFNLAAGTNYAIGIQTDIEYSYDILGFYFRTLDRWEFAKQLFREQDQIDVILLALTNIVSDKKFQVLDEIERLQRLKTIAEITGNKFSLDENLSILTQ